MRVKTVVARRGSMAIAALLVVTLGMASAAWACSAMPHIARSQSSAGQDSGPSGSKVEVSGRDFGEGLVEVRWDTRSGQLLGQAQGPNFTLEITIPQAPAGVHYIVAFRTTATATGSMAFEVTPSRSTSDDSSPESTANTSNSAGAPDEEESTAEGNGSEGTSTSDGGGTTGTNTGSSNTASNTGSSTGTSTGSNSGTNNASTGTGGQTAPAGASVESSSPATPAAANTARRPRAASANAPAVTAPSGQVVFGGSSAAPVDEVLAVASPAAIVSGDTWSGFAASDKPSLLSEPVEGPSTSNSGLLALALALAAAAMTALVAGFGVAEMSRKRALAAGQTR